MFEGLNCPTVVLTPVVVVLFKAFSCKLREEDPARILRYQINSLIRLAINWGQLLTVFVFVEREYISCLYLLRANTRIGIQSGISCSCFTHSARWPTTNEVLVVSGLCWKKLTPKGCETSDLQRSCNPYPAWSFWWSPRYSKELHSALLRQTVRGRNSNILLNGTVR